MDAMPMENINWLVPPAAKDASGAAMPAFTQPWPDPYTDMLDMGPLDPSFTASLEESIVDPNLLGGFEEASKAVEAVETGASAAAAAASTNPFPPIKGEFSTDTSPDLDFFSHPSESNRSSSLITPDSLPPALPTPPLLANINVHAHAHAHAHASQQQQQQQQQQPPPPKRRGRPQKRQSPQQEEKSPSKRKRRSPQKTTPTGLSPIIQPDFMAASAASASSSSSSFLPVSSAFLSSPTTAIAGPSTEFPTEVPPEIPPEIPSEILTADATADATFDAEAEADADPAQAEGQEPQPAQSKRSRIREKNRIAACKCRRKQRKAVSKLTSTHEGLEDLNRQLCGQVSELEAEAYMLKNMLMAHGNCGCEMIQQYFRDAAANLVQKSDPDAGSSSASGSRARTNETLKSTEKA